MNLAQIQYDEEMFKAGTIHARFKMDKKCFPLHVRLVLKDLHMYKDVRAGLMSRGWFDKFDDAGRWIG